MTWAEFKTMVKQNCYTDGTDPFSGAVSFLENHTRTGLRIAQRYLKFFRDNNEVALSSSDLTEDTGLARVELALTEVRELEYARKIGYSLVLDIDHGGHVKNGTSVNGQWLLEKGGTVSEGPWVRGPFRLRIVDEHPVSNEPGYWYVIEDDEGAVVYVSSSAVIDGMLVEDAGELDSLGIYERSGDQNGYPFYAGATTPVQGAAIRADTAQNQWVVYEDQGVDWYKSTDFPATPDLAAGWDAAENGPSPMPKVRRAIPSDVAGDAEDYTQLSRVSAFDYYNGQPGDPVTSSISTTHSVVALYQRRPLRRLPWPERERLATNDVVKAGGYEDACNILQKGRLPLCYAYVREPDTDWYILSPHPGEDDKIIARYSGIKMTWADGDIVPYGEELAYAVAQFVLSRILVVQQGKRTAANDLYAEFMNEISGIRREHRG